MQPQHKATTSATMSQATMFAEPVGEVMTDHELVAHYQVCVRQMFAGCGTRRMRAATAAVRHFLQYKVVTHFAYEEEYILPGLLQVATTKKAARLITQLQNEHRTLERKADQLDAMLMAADGAGEHDPLLRKALRDFFHDLQKHADLENKLFPTLLSQPTARPTVSRLGRR